MPAGDDNSETNSLNNYGQIVGDSGVGSLNPMLEIAHFFGRTAYVSTCTRSFLMIPPTNSPWLPTSTRGEIAVCAVQRSSGNLHAALLTPQATNVSGNDGGPAPQAGMTLPFVSARAQHMLKRKTPEIRPHAWPD